MATDVRVVKENPVIQHPGDESPWGVKCTPWGSSPAYVGTEVYDVSDGGRTSVTATVTKGTGSASGDIVTGPVVYNLTAGHDYQEEIKISYGSGTKVLVVIIRIQARY